MNKKGKVGLIFLAVIATILIGIGVSNYFAHDQSQETKITQKYSSKRNSIKKKISNGKALSNKKASQKGEIRQKSEGSGREEVQSALKPLDPSANSMDSLGIMPILGSNTYSKKVGLAVASRQMFSNKTRKESQILSSHSNNDLTNLTFDGSTNKQQLITVSGRVANSSGIALTNTKIIARNQTTLVSFTTDNEGNFYTHLPVNNDFSFIDQSGTLLGNVKVSGNADSQVTNKNGNITLGKKFFSENSTDAYLQLSSATIYFSSNEVISGSNNSVILAGNQEVYVGDVILADQNADHQGALTLKVKKVIKKNNQTILTGITPSTEEVFQEIHTNNSVSLGKETFIPNYNYIESASTPRIFARSLIQFGTPFRQSLTFKHDIELDGLHLHDLQGELSERPDFEINYSKTKGVRKINLGLELKATLSGLINMQSSADGIKLPIGRFVVPTDLPFISINTPVNIKFTGESSSGIEPEISLSKYVGVEINKNSVRNLSQASDGSENGIAFGSDISTGFSLGVGFAPEPSISVVEDPLVKIETEVGIKGDYSLSNPFSKDLDANEVDSLYYSIGFKKPQLLQDTEIGNSYTFFETGKESLYDENNNAVNSLSLPENSTKTLKLPDSWKDRNIKIMTSGPISVKRTGDLLTVSATNMSNMPQTAHLLVLDFANFPHLINKKAALNVNIGNFGRVTGQVVNALSTKPIKNSSITFTNKSTAEKYTVKTDATGNYNQELPVGSYTADFKATGYKSETNNKIEVTDQTVTYNAKLKLIGLDYTDIGNVSGIVHDALTSNSIEEAELSFRSGLNNTTGKVVNTASTDEDGNYQVKLPGGNYTMEMKKDGYVIGYQNILAVGHRLTENQNGVLVPDHTDYDYRIVLQWGEDPSDLDSHLTGPMSDQDGRFHVYFRDKDYRDSGTDARLDVDDTTSYGPETITSIKEMLSGTYTYAVHKYAGEGELADSSATVKVYRGADLVKEYNVPSQSGNLWNVFQITNGQIQTINQMTTIDDETPTIDELAPK